MKSLFGMLGGLMVYFALASMVTLALLLLYAKSQGYLAPDRVAKMLAVARGEQLPAAAARQSKQPRNRLQNPTMTNRFVNRISAN